MFRKSSKNVKNTKSEVSLEKIEINGDTLF